MGRAGKSLANVGICGKNIENLENRCTSMEKFIGNWGFEVGEHGGKVWKIWRIVMKIWGEGGDLAWKQMGKTVKKYGGN